MEGVTEFQANTKPPIPEPDLENLDSWLNSVVDKPGEGYKTSSKPNGKPYSPEEQLDLTRKQYTDMVNIHKQLRTHDNPRMRSHALNDNSLKKELIAAVRADKVSTKFR